MHLELRMVPTWLETTTQSTGYTVPRRPTYFIGQSLNVYAINKVYIRNVFPLAFKTGG